MPITPTAVCNSYTDIISNQGAVINNSDGTVSVFVKNNVGALVPFPLIEKCCNLLAQTQTTGTPYYWDARAQTCRWDNTNGAGNSSDTCTLDSVFKLVLNPAGNDGALFTIDNLNQNAHLDISFDYLFKFTCESLNALTLGASNILNFTLHRTTGNGVWSDHLVLKFGNTNVTFADFNLIANNPTVATVNAAIAAGIITNGYTLTCTSVNNVATTISFQLTTNNNSIVGTTVGAVSDPFVVTTVNVWGNGNGPFGGGNNSLCNPIQALETLDVSVTLDVENGNTTTTVAEYQMFSSIGQNNLRYHLITHPTNSGFFICGDPVNGDPSNLTSCSPLITTGSNSTNVFTCNTLKSYINSQIGGGLPANAFNSDWIRFSTTVTDSNILDQLKNKKIKLSIKVNDACVNFCVLLDNITLGTQYSNVTQNNIFLTKSPGFTLDRIRDNKKAWVKNTTPIERSFEITRSDGTNLIRGTKYNVNDERLVINSKEIDLDISLASAIETDVWGYVVDNPCLLTGLTTTCGCSRNVCTENDLVVNGKFITDLSDWSTVSWVWSAGTAYLSGFGTPKKLSQNINNLIDGQTYIARFTVTNLSGGIGLRASLFEDSTSLGIITNGTYSIERVYNAASTDVNASGIMFQNQGAITVSVDDVSVEIICPTGSTGTTTISIGGLQSQNAMVGVGNPYQFNSSATSSFEQDSIVSPVVGNYYTMSYTISNLTSGSVGVSLFKVGNPASKADDIRTADGTYTLTKQYLGSVGGGYISVNEQSSSPLTIITVNSITSVDVPPAFENLPSCCGDDAVDYSALLTQPISAITVVEDFEFFIASELIDAKDRKTLSAYPTLRGLYDRYLNSSGYCSNISSAFSYKSVDQFAGLVGNYWVDIIEQVVPATTIWGATKIYSNTIFDSQKFKYKAYTLLMGDNVFEGMSVLSPASGSSTGVEVVTTVISPTGNTLTSTYSNPYLVQMNNGSEFIGTVTIIGGSGGSQNNQTLFAG